MNNNLQEQFETMLIFLVPQIVKMMAEKAGISQEEAARSFYTSKVYSFLEKEETKVWHFSPLTLYTMYKQEMETGAFDFPEEC